MKRENLPGHTHPVHVVHRISAVAIGLALWLFAGMGFARGLPFFSTDGEMVLGMSSNGALSVLSVAAGAILLAAAARGGATASTVSIGMGALFLASGIGHLAVLHTQWNVFAFQLPNVFFSLVVGLVLLVLGFYGRVSGGLPPDNPYRREHPVRQHRPDPDEQLGDESPDPGEQEMLQAELAMGAGRATPEQAALVKRDQARRRAEERARAHRHAPWPGEPGPAQR